MIRRAAALAAFLVLAGGLAACSQGGGSAAAPSNDPNAGLSDQILKWRGEIVKTDPLCQAADQKCSDFEVTCKAMRTITPDEQAKGVTNKIVASLGWNGFDPKLKQAQAGVGAAEFTKTPQGWTRSKHSSVNPTTCADL